MKSEIIIWGKPKNQEHEVILSKKAKSIDEANLISEVLQNRFGCTEIRIAIFDITEKPDFVKTINF